MKKIFPLDAVITDGVPDITYSAADFAAVLAAFVTDGILTADSFEVTADEMLDITVSAGSAIIAGRTYVCDQSEALTLSECTESSRRRRDAVVLRLNLEERTVEPAVIRGTYAMNPQAPAAVNDGNTIDILLATVLVDSGNEITAASITDARTMAQSKLN